MVAIWTPSAVTGFGPWKWLCDGTNGGVSTSCIAYKPDSWQSNGPEGAGVKTVTIDPNNSQTIYAGTNTWGVYKTFNGGTSWTQINSRIHSYYTDKTVRALAIDPNSSGQTIYAGTDIDSVH